MIIWEHLPLPFMVPKNRLRNLQLNMMSIIRYWCKSLADRFVEAFAECLHEKVRKEYWGYEKNETLTNEAIDQRRI